MEKKEDFWKDCKMKSLICRGLVRELREKWEKLEKIERKMGKSWEI